MRKSKFTDEQIAFALKQVAWARQVGPNAVEIANVNDCNQRLNLKTTGSLARCLPLEH